VLFHARVVLLQVSRSPEVRVWRRNDVSQDYISAIERSRRASTSESTVASARHLVRPSTHHTLSYCICALILYWLLWLSGQPTSLISTPVLKWFTLRRALNSSSATALGTTWPSINLGYSASLVTVAYRYDGGITCRSQPALPVK